MTAIKKKGRGGQDIVVADNICMLYKQCALFFFIKQYNTKQSSTSSRHNGFPIYRVSSVKDNETCQFLSSLHFREEASLLCYL